MRSPQTLSEADRRLLAAWAADCAERVLGVFETAAPGDERPRALIARARAFASAEVGTAEAIRGRFAGGVGATDVASPAAMAAARAAGQAAAVCHMGAHALGAAAYAVRAADHADPDRVAAPMRSAGVQVQGRGAGCASLELGDHPVADDVRALAPTQEGVGSIFQPYRISVLAAPEVLGSAEGRVARFEGSPAEFGRMIISPMPGLDLEVPFAHQEVPG